MPGGDTSERRLKRCRLATLVKVLAGFEGLAGGKRHHDVERLCVHALEGLCAFADARVFLRVPALVDKRNRIGILVHEKLAGYNCGLRCPAPPVGHDQNALSPFSEEGT